MILSRQRAAAGTLQEGYPCLLADLRFASPTLELEFHLEEADRSRRLARTPQVGISDFTSLE